MVDDFGGFSPNPVSEAAELYQEYHREVLPAGTVGPILTITVPPEVMRPWFGSFNGPMSLLVCRWTPTPGFALGVDGWTIYATSPLVPGSYYLGVTVGVSAADRGGASYRIQLTVKG